MPYLKSLPNNVTIPLGDSKKLHCEQVILDKDNSESGKTTPSKLPLATSTKQLDIEKKIEAIYSFHKLFFQYMNMYSNKRTQPSRSQLPQTIKKANNNKSRWLL